MGVGPGAEDLIEPACQLTAEADRRLVRCRRAAQALMPAHRTGQRRGLMAGRAQVRSTVAGGDGDPADAATPAALALGMAVAGVANRLAGQFRCDCPHFTARRALRRRRLVARRAQRFAALGPSVDGSVTAAHRARSPPAGVAAHARRADRRAVGIAAGDLLDSAAPPALLKMGAVVAHRAAWTPLVVVYGDRALATAVHAPCGPGAVVAGDADPLGRAAGVEQLDLPAAPRAARNHQDRRAGIDQGCDQRADHLRRRRIPCRQTSGVIGEVAGETRARDRRGSHPLDNAANKVGRQRRICSAHQVDDKVGPFLQAPHRCRRQRPRG